MKKQLIKDLKEIKLAIFDLDGVIYRGDKLLPSVDKTIQDLKELSIRVVYNSNNSTATRQMYVDRLKKYNIDSKVSDFYTSASITASEITKIKQNSKVFVIGEIGLQEELEAMGHTIISNKGQFDEIDFVVVGLDRNFNYNDIAFAQKSILKGKAQFYATNTDTTLPIANGLLPGAGVMVKAIEVCTSTKPIKIFGKPDSCGIKSILTENKMSPKQVAIFGDRLDTDILAGNRAKIKTVLVLTGVTNYRMVEELKMQVSKAKGIDKDLFPDLIIKNLSEIFT
ncbi:MAG: HAD-IIA family hydrolase [Promethearchaeota archaeon]